MADGVERFAALWMYAWAEGVWSNRNSTWMIRAKRVFNERVDGHEQGKMCIEDWTEKKNNSIEKQKWQEWRIFKAIFNLKWIDLNSKVV